jgi:hypothetical protein
MEARRSSETSVYTAPHPRRRRSSLKWMLKKYILKIWVQPALEIAVAEFCRHGDTNLSFIASSFFYLEITPLEHNGNCTYDGLQR